MTAGPAPKLTRPTYHVWLDPRPGVTADSPELDTSELEYHHVTVNAGDQLRAELEAKRLGLGKPQDTPMHLSMLWLWAALVRTKRYDDKFPAFKLACIAYDPDKADDETPGDEVVPTVDSTS